MSFEVNARRRLDCWDDIVHGDRNIRGVFGEGLERKMKGLHLRKHRWP